MTPDREARRPERSTASSVPPEAVVPPRHRRGPQGLQPDHLYKAAGLLFVFALFYRFFDTVAQVLLVAYAAVVLAVALNVVVGLFPSQRRWVAGALGVAILGAVFALLWFGVPALAREVRGFTARIPEFQQEIQQWMAWLRQNTGLDVQLIGDQSRRFFERFFSGIQGSDVVGQARGLLEILFLPLLILFGALYAVGKPNDLLLNPVLRAVPRDRRLAARRALELLGSRLRGWVKGTLIAMLAVGLLSTVSFYLIGLEYALTLGILNGFTEMIPILGPWVGGAVAVAVALLDDPSRAVWVLLVVLAIQQVESNLITPLVMARVAEVHPFVTLFALLLFGGLFGFLGVLLALPLVLLIWTVTEVFWVERAIDTDQDPIAPVVRE